MYFGGVSDGVGVGWFRGRGLGLRQVYCLIFVWVLERVLCWIKVVMVVVRFGGVEGLFVYCPWDCKLRFEYKGWKV